MARGQGNDQVFAHQRRFHQPLLGGQQGANEGGIHAPRKNGGRKQRRGAFVQAQGHGGVTATKLTDHPRNQRVKRGRVDHAQPQAPQFSARNPAHADLGLLSLLYQRAGIIEQGFAGGRQFHAARQSAKQRGAQMLLQRLDLLRQRWLRHAQLPGGAGDMSRFGNGNEVAQCAQLK